MRWHSPNFKGMSVKTYLKHVRTYAKAIVNNALKDIPSRAHISVTCDIWTTPNLTFAFQGVIIHWIDNDWKLRHLLVDVQVCADKTGGTNGDHLLTRLKELGLADRFRVLTADSGPGVSQSFMRGWLGQEFGADKFKWSEEVRHLPCTSHALQRACGDFFVACGVQPPLESSQTKQARKKHRLPNWGDNSQD